MLGYRLTLRSPAGTVSAWLPDASADGSAPRWILRTVVGDAERPVERMAFIDDVEEHAVVALGLRFVAEVEAVYDGRYDTSLSEDENRERHGVSGTDYLPTWLVDRGVPLRPDWDAIAEARR